MMHAYKVLLELHGYGIYYTDVVSYDAELGFLMAEGLTRKLITYDESGTG